MPIKLHKFYGHINTVNPRKKRLRSGIFPTSKFIFGIGFSSNLNALPATSVSYNSKPPKG